MKAVLHGGPMDGTSVDWIGAIPPTIDRGVEKYTTTAKRKLKPNAEGIQVTDQECVHTLARYVLDQRRAAAPRMVDGVCIAEFIFAGFVD